MTTRSDVVRVARSYVGTPYHHAARLPGVGLDCAGVPICCARELGLVPPDFDVPAYTPSPDGHSMMEWCTEHLGDRVTRDAMQPGDIIVLQTDMHPQHLGVLTNHAFGGLGIVHACTFAGVQKVIETRLAFSRIQQFVAAFSFRGVA